MTSLFQVTNQLFEWCHSQAIDLVMARPKFHESDFVNSDLDIVIHEHDIERIIQWLDLQHYITICSYKRSDGITSYFYNKNEQFSFHIDFITSLQIRNIPFLSITEVLNRKIEEKGISYPDPIDQIIILIMTHGLKHKSRRLLAKHSSYIQDIIMKSPMPVLERFQYILGEKTGTTVFDALIAKENVNITYWPFLVESWKNYGGGIIVHYIAYYFKEFYRRYQMPIYRIAFLGVDGAGKTSLINALKVKLSEIFPTIRHSRFIPELPWKNEKDSNNILQDPHKYQARSYFLSIIKLIYYFMRYWIVVGIPRKTPVLYLHDRYISDMLVDPKRYRYAGPVIQSLLWLYPKPLLTILVDIAPMIALERKNEISQVELFRQISAYRTLQEALIDTVLVNGNNAMKQNVMLVEDAIITKLKSRN